MSAPLASSLMHHPRPTYQITMKCTFGKKKKRERKNQIESKQSIGKKETFNFSSSAGVFASRFTSSAIRALENGKLGKNIYAQTKTKYRCSTLSTLSMLAVYRAHRTCADTKDSDINSNMNRAFQTAACQTGDYALLPDESKICTANRGQSGSARHRWCVIDAVVAVVVVTKLRHIEYSNFCGSHCNGFCCRATRQQTLQRYLIE